MKTKQDLCRGCLKLRRLDHRQLCQKCRRIVLILDAACAANPDIPRQRLEKIVRLVLQMRH